MNLNADFVNKLRNSGLRPTKQRLKICEALFNTDKTFHFTINDLSVGIDVHNNQRAYRVYPNPTNGELMLEFYNSEIISLNVRDVTGKELLNIDLELGQEKTILDLQQLNSGLYFLHLLGQDKNYIVPVVKQ